jgi:hypothetical protein
MKRAILQELLSAFSTAFATKDTRLLGVALSG